MVRILDFQVMATSVLKWIVFPSKRRAIEETVLDHGIFNSASEECE